VSDKELIASLQKQVSELSELVSSLQAELAWYKSNRNSHNSHLPPSRDLHKPTAPKRKRKKSNRNPGGQHGHKANWLEKVDTPDEVVVHDVNVCQHCGEDIPEQPGTIVRTGQVFDIPRIELKVTEHHKICKCCPKCGQHTTADLPGSLDYLDAQYGVNLKNLVTYLSSRQYCSVSRIAECIRILTGANISTGFVWDTIHQKAEQLRPTYDQLLEKIKESPVVGSDETGCRIGEQKAWMWVWCNDRYVYLKTSNNRGYATLKETLGDQSHAFVMVSDCYPAQLKVTTADKQICLAHLLRECEGLHEQYKSQWAILLKSKLEQIIVLTRQEVIEQKIIMRIERELLSILKRVRGRAHEKVEVFRDRLYKLCRYITTCLRNRLVPPTNNMSERALRSTKVKLRVSSLFRTFTGAQDYAILRSIIDTAILQGKHPFDALVTPEIVVN
jgi:transposase